MASRGTNLAPIDGERTNKKRKKKKQRRVCYQGRKRSESATPFKGCEGVGEQAEIHRVIYTPFGTKILPWRPRFKQRVLITKESRLPTLCKQRAGRRATLYPSSDRLRGWQTGSVLSIPDGRTGGQTVACFVSAGSVSNSSGTPGAGELKGLSVGFLKTRSVGCAVCALDKHWLAAGCSPPPSHFPIHHPRFHHKLPRILGSC